MVEHRAYEFKRLTQILLYSDNLCYVEVLSCKIFLFQRIQERQVW